MGGGEVRVVKQSEFEATNKLYQEISVVIIVYYHKYKPTPCLLYP